VQWRRPRLGVRCAAPHVLLLNLGSLQSPETAATGRDAAIGSAAMQHSLPARNRTVAQDQRHKMLAKSGPDGKVRAFIPALEYADGFARPAIDLFRQAGEFRAIQRVRVMPPNGDQLGVADPHDARIMIAAE